MENLKALTSQFFERHWPKDEESKIPEWSEPWSFKSSVPNNEQGGCYAWLNNEGNVIYVGVALSMGDGIYKGHSLGHRISGYWKVRKNEPMDSDGIRQYESTKEGVDAIMTIGFPVKYGYLAAALELYLIQNIKPERNTIYKYSS